MAKKSTAIDVTQGVIWQQLLSLCVPIFFSSFFQQAYTLIGTGYAFAYCSNLKSIIVSDSVTGFPETTFYDCTSLEKIIFGTGLTTGGVFWDSKYIKEIHGRSTIPPSIIGFNNEVYNNATLYVDVYKRHLFAISAYGLHP